MIYFIVMLQWFAIIYLCNKILFLASQIEIIFEVIFQYQEEQNDNETQ